MLWLLSRGLRRATRRLALAAVGIAFPVGVLAATLLLVDHAAREMTPTALAPVQVEMRALATSLDVDMNAVRGQLASVPGVRRVERFASADVVLSAPGAPGPVTARMFAVDPSYLERHPWVRVQDGDLARGVLLNQALRAAPGFAAATAVAIELPGGDVEEPAPPVPLAVGGTSDLRQARFWFEVPLGEVQGDVASVPRALVIDYATFERSVLPALKRARGGDAAPVLNPAATDLAPVSLEAHISVDHAAYPTDPARAVSFSTALRRTLERRSPGAIAVADNAAEALIAAQEDATSAKILFLLLGIPGALAAGALGLAAASALAEAQRREDALLELRGATTRQLAWLTAAHAGVAGLAGSALGLLAAVGAVALITGAPVWREVPPERLAASALLAVAVGALTSATRIVPLVRAARRADVVRERGLLERGWVPGWRRSRLDLLAIAVGAAILAVNALAGGLRQTPIEGQTVALAFYVLLAPIALWFGVTLLVVRGLLALLARWTRPERARPLSSWTGAALRWLGRRPARTGVALVLGALAIAFGANVITFVSTYEAARLADDKAAFGSDLRLFPPAEAPAAAPPAHAGIAGVSPARVIPAKIGTDRKSILAIDPASYRAAITVDPLILDGAGLDAFTDPSAAVISKELSSEFEVNVGDTLTLTAFPDDEGQNRNLKLRVAGVFRSFPPNEPFAELVIGVGAVSGLLPAPDFYLVRVAAGHSADRVADDLRRSAAFAVATRTQLTKLEQRSLAALNLRGMSRLESVAAGLIAAVGVAVLGAFLVLERRREAAVLRAVGATDRQVLTSPALEGAVAVVGSLVIGVPVGIGLSVLAIRVLGLFFTLPPPLLVLPARGLAGLAAFTVAASLLALGGALFAVVRGAAASVLREP